MDIRDFQGLYKYKLILPAIYVISWVCMFLGPSLFPVLYRKMCFLVLFYLTLKTISLGVINFIMLIGNYRVLNRSQRRQHKQYIHPQRAGEQKEQKEQIMHTFIIPSYKQDKELIAETLNVLSNHRRSKSNYLVFLAMEKHEEGSDIKARQIIRQFASKFKYMDYTCHEVRQYEQKGKAANVSWCAEHLQQKFNKLSIDPDNVFVTCLDVDSWAPDVYFDEVQDHIYENFEKRFTYIYQPPQVFTRNHLEVPIMSRVYDYMHSCMHAANLFSLIGITFPLSNYTLSFNLIKRMGFWDTVEEAIGEDFHTMQKAVWKTKGQVTGVPIYAPWNQLNIQTGNGYCSDLEARFWQAQRHARGLGDVAYTFHMFLKEKMTCRLVWMCLVVLELFFLPAIMPWVYLSLIYQSVAQDEFTRALPQMIQDETFSYLYNIMTLTTILTFLCFEIAKRRSTQILYGLKNESIYRFLELALMYLPNVLFITIPVMIIAAFGSLKSNRQYVVADKMIKRKENV